MIGFPPPEGSEAYQGALVRYWWIVALATIAAVAAVAFFTPKLTATYRVSTTLVVGPSEKLKTPREVVDSLSTLDRRSVVATFALFPSSHAVRTKALQQLRLPADDLALYAVRTAVLPDSNVLEVSVDGPDPRSATAFTNAVADQTIAAAGDIYPIYGMTILDPAVPSTAPVQPDVSRRLLAGTFFGLLIGLAAAFVLNRLRWSTHRVEDWTAHKTTVE